MRKRFWILAAAVALAAAGGITSAAVAASGFEGEARRARVEADLTAGGYVLADHEGHVGLFDGDRLILDAGIPVSGLRQIDRELIVQGIRADTYEDALRLLEDLGA